jgi:hypothetical protein
MAKKKSKKNNKKKPVNKEFAKEIRHLEVILRLSENAITTQNSSVDKFFIAQADKIRLKINNLKENQ